MAETNIGIANIPVSELQDIPANEQLSAESLFLVSVPQKDNQDNISSYTSEKVEYSKLAREISSSLDIGGIEERITELSGSFRVKETLNYLSDLTSYGPTVISALQENNRGQIVSISGYVLSNAISNILDNVVLPRVSATNSPWVKKSDVKSEIGDSNTLVASQKLVTDISNILTSKYVLKSSVKSEMGQSTTFVASQKLVYDLSNRISTDYINKSEIKTDLNSPNSTNVASQLLIKSLSDCVDDNFLALSNVVNELGNSPTDAASQALVTSLSNTVTANYVKKGGTDSLVPLSDIVSILGNNEGKVASQKLVTQISTECMTQINSHIVRGNEGEVFYLSESGDPIKKTILELSVYVCENSAEINSAQVSARVNGYKIADQRNNTISVYQDTTLIPLPTLATQEIGFGRLVKNTLTNKTFFTTQTGLIKFAEYS